MNADIAAAGFVVAVLFAPNERFYPEVQAAEQRAQEYGNWLFEPGIDCTVPAMVEDAVAGLDALDDTVPAGAAGVEAALGGVVTAAIVVLRTKNAALKALDSSADSVNSVVWAAGKATYLPVLNAAMDRATGIESMLAGKQAALAQAKKEAEEGKVAKAKKEAEQRKAALERQAEEREEEQKGNERETETEVKKTPGDGALEKKGKPKNGGFPGYNGPRCYGNGGTDWEFCWPESE
ncbi:hypothetical protein CQ018_12450 [Arthrobacter sp. MYb227]|uniref:hypothetical protein n=1 Tax=Arthrobacter sp. MYb227 TaxID=1848601 RepID=UPI000D491341|nr:hypothetical protein [Arthrobacter sp. MYb227]PQZ92308.1 hypothetical protein CQ018_12450 [Arthrobacter sp. MYb227]